ncbi:MAG: hypothetical protein RL557_274 [archaeon]|jgi:hypothetical protein
MKKITILKHGGGELANQLWNYISIYAYSLENGDRVSNPSFFEYHSYFSPIKNERILTKFLSFWFKNFSGRRSSPRSRFWRFIYSLYSEVIQLLRSNCVVSSENQENIVTYLPPTSSSIHLENKKKLYFTGWLFRNPVGIKKFRKEIVNAFSANEKILARVHAIIQPFRQQYDRIVGVHIRQHDYKVFKNGAYFISQDRVRGILREYEDQFYSDIRRTLFLITSDGPIDQSVFQGINIYVSKENAVIDLFMLSKTDTIIGSDSSFGAFASWYGDIPHIVMKKESMDWEYYKGRKEFFENKYCKLAHF